MAGGQVQQQQQRWAEKMLVLLVFLSARGCIAYEYDYYIQDIEEDYAPNETGYG